MRRYLATLHQRPAHHKRRFALGVSSAFTLTMFAIWTLVNFGHGGVLATNDQQQTTNSTYREVSPLESLRDSMAASFEALRDNFGELKEGFNDLNLKEQYEALKDGAVETYHAR